MKTVVEYLEATKANTLTDLNVVVDRKSWYRGKGDKSSKLLKNDGRMCCLGFAAIADGAEPKHIRNICSPVSIRTPNILTRCFYKHDIDDNYTTRKLMQINDDKNLDGTKREAQLIEHGKKIKINFSFVG